MNITEYIELVLKKLRETTDTKEFVRLLKLLRDTIDETIEKMEKL